MCSDVPNALQSTFVLAAIMAPKGKIKAEGKSKADAKKKTSKRGAAEAPTPIAMPNVSAKDVEEAQKLLKDEADKRRANSNMMYWLQTNGKRNNYDALLPKDRKQFALMWYAWSLKDGDTTKLTKRASGTEKIEKDIGKWMCKNQIIDKYGKDKGESKIKVLDAEPTRHRPDRDTGEDGEWHREYKIFEDGEEEANFDRCAHELNNTKEIQGVEAMQEAEEDMASFKLLQGGDDPNASAAGSSGPEKKIKVEGELPNEDLKTFNKLKTNPKAVLRTIQDNIMELKRMFERAKQPERAKYTEILRADITKLLPKLKSDHNAVEKLHLTQDETIPDPELLATARKLDKNFEIITEIIMWYKRLCPDDKKGSQRHLIKNKGSQSQRRCLECNSAFCKSRLRIVAEGGLQEASFIHAIFQRSKLKPTAS